MARTVRPQSGTDDWKKVKVTCFEVPGYPAGLSRAESEKQVLAMIKDFFPAGPQAAMRAHAEFKAWVKEGQDKGEVRCPLGGNTASFRAERVSDGVRQWDALWRNWENYSVWMEAAGPA